MPDILEDFEAAVLTGDTSEAMDRWAELQKAVKAKKKAKKSAYCQPKELEHDHPMDGLEDADHTRHIRFHEDEFHKLSLQLAHEPDPQRKQVIVAAMRNCAKHWDQHRLHKHLPPLKDQDKLLKEEHFEEADPLAPLQQPDKKPLKKAVDSDPPYGVMEAIREFQSGDTEHSELVIRWNPERRKIAGSVGDWADASKLWNAIKNTPGVEKTEFDSEWNCYAGDPGWVTLTKAIGDHPFEPGSAEFGEEGECAKVVTYDGEKCHCGAPESEHLSKAVNFAGFKVKIENPAGSIRRGKNPARPWEQMMMFDYGEITGTEGVDGDPVDVILGPDQTAPFVYVVHQHDIGKVLAWPGGQCPKCGELPANCPHDYDEDKCMLGFPSLEEAVAAFSMNYDQPDRFLGPVTTIPVTKFREYLKTKRGEVLKAVLEAQCWTLAKALGLHKKHPLVHMTPDGATVHVYTPHKHATFVAALHAAVPNKSERTWNGPKSRWEVAGKHLHVVAALTHKFWDASKHPKDAHGHFIHTAKLLENKGQQKHPLHDAVKEAVAHLSMADPDKAGKQNGVGWNGGDSDFGHSLNQQGSLTWNQVEAGLKTLQKYKNTQIPHLADELFGEKAKQAMAAVAGAASLKGMAIKPEGVQESSHWGTMVDSVKQHVQAAYEEAEEHKADVDPEVVFDTAPQPPKAEPSPFVSQAQADAWGKEQTYSTEGHVIKDEPAMGATVPNEKTWQTNLPPVAPGSAAAPAEAPQAADTPVVFDEEAPTAEAPSAAVLAALQALEELGGTAFIQAIAGKAGLKVGEAKDQLLAALHQGLVEINHIGQWHLLPVGQADEFPPGFNPIGPEDWHKTQTSPWLQHANITKLAMLPDKYKGWKSHVLQMSEVELAAHPMFSDWEKGFLKDNLGKGQAAMSYKQIGVVQKLQQTHKKWILANPEVIPGLWNTANSAQLKAAAAEQAALYEKASIIAEQTNTDLDLPPGIDLSGLIDNDLFPHQKAGINWLKAAKRGILALATGLGKTFTVITAFESLKHEGKADRMGFVVPKGRLVGTVQDIEKIFPGKKIVVLSGSSIGSDAEVQAKFKGDVKVFTGSIGVSGDDGEEGTMNADVIKAIEEADYVVSGYDPVRKYANVFKQYCQVMALDEAVRVKGKDSQISKKVIEHFQATPYLWYMSATPIPNNPLDLWVLMRGLSPKTFGDEKSFKKTHCLTKMVQAGKIMKSVITGYVDSKKTREHVAHLIYHRDYTSPDVLVSMPPKVQTKEHLDMPEDMQTVYKAAQQQILEKVLSEGAAKFNPKMILTELLRLEQISLTPRLLDPTYFGSEPKLDRAAEIAREHFAAQEAAGAATPKGIIFFSHFVGAQPYLQEHLEAKAGLAKSEIASIQGQDYRVGGKKVKTIQDVVDAMNSGQCKALIASDAAMEGLNLQFGATALVHLDTPWRPDALEQREGRIYRPGQKMTCNFTHLAMNNPIENKKLQTVEKKAADQAAIISGEGDVEEISGFSFQDALQALGYETPKGN